MAMTTARVTLPLYNLGCGGGEALAIQRAIATTPGVTQVYINSLTEMAYVVYDSSLLGRAELSAALERLGYGAPHPDPQREPTVTIMQPVECRSDRRQTGPQQNRKEQSGMIEQLTQPTRSKYTFTIVLVIIAVLAGAALWIWRTAAPTQPASSVSTAALSAGTIQTSEGGQVTIAATWQGNSAGPIFQVAMNTHAVDLDGYDLKQLAALRVDGGPEVQPTNWEAPKGGHHRSGTLTFPATRTDGTPLIGPDAHTIELVIRDIAGVSERVFTWRP